MIKEVIKNQLVSLLTIDEIKEIENADNLELAIVSGYQCVVKKEIYNVGDQVFYIRPDTVLPDNSEKYSWAQSYLQYAPKRVKTIRLRGIYSEGIIVPYDVLLPYLKNNISKDDILNGKDISDYIGVIKYEPPIKGLQLDAKGYLPYSIPKTDETRIEEYFKNEIFKSQIPFGENVDITLKVDGQSATYYYKLDEDQFGVTSRSLELKPECVNNYTKHIEKYDLENKLKEYCKKYNVSIALRGESYGGGIQNMGHNPHSRLNGLAFFSVYLIDEHRYARKGDPHYFTKVCRELDLPMVPILEGNVVFTEEYINKYRDELEKIDGDYFEGVVVQHSKGSFKIINRKYETKK